MRIKASLAYIEAILKDIDNGISSGESIYKNIHNDLTPEQLAKVKSEIKKMKSLLKKAKEEFNIKEDTFQLSHLIYMSSSYIWETLEDLWAHKLDKAYGKIKSEEKKEKLDALVGELLEHNHRLNALAGHK